MIIFFTFDSISYTCNALYTQAGYATETARYRDIYDDILDMALEIKAIINTHNITKIGFALDSSISQVSKSSIILTAIVSWT